MARINVDFILPFITATEKMYVSMIGKRVERVEVYEKKNYVMSGEISGVIGMTGQVTGTTAISMPAKVAAHAIGSLLGEEVCEDTEDVTLQDGVGELVNLIAGQAKAIVAERGIKFNISLPTIISGAGHELYHSGNTRCVGVVFRTEDEEEFSVEVCVADRA